MDGQDPKIVDRAGFRGLMRLLAPKYEMPSAQEFLTKIIPSVMNQLQADVPTIKQRFRQNK